MPYYNILCSAYGHTCLTRETGKNSAERIAGTKPWGGGSVLVRFSSRRDELAIKRYNKWRAGWDGRGKPSVSDVRRGLGLERPVHGSEVV